MSYVQMMARSIADKIGCGLRITLEKSYSMQVNEGAQNPQPATVPGESKKREKKKVQKEGSAEGRTDGRTTEGRKETRRQLKERRKDGSKESADDAEIDCERVVK